MRAFAPVLAVSLLAAGCLFPSDDNGGPSSLDRPADGSPAWWEVEPEDLRAEAPSGVEERPSHIKFHVRAFGVTIVDRSYDRYQVAGNIGLVAGDGWSVLDLLDAAELNVSQKKDQAMTMIGGAEHHATGKGIFAARAGPDLMVGYTSRDIPLFASIYDDTQVCDILRIPGFVALLVGTPGRFTIHHLKEGESAITTRSAEDIDDTGFDSAFAVDPFGPLLAADGFGNVWTFPKIEGRAFRDPVKSDVNVGADSARMRCADDVCAASDAVAGIVTFFAIDEAAQPVGQPVKESALLPRAIAAQPDGDQRHFWVTSQEMLLLYTLTPAAALLSTTRVPLPADCPNPRDVAVSEADANGAVQVFVGCGEDGAVLSKPVVTRQVVSAQSTVF